MLEQQFRFRKITWNLRGRLTIETKRWEKLNTLGLLGYKSSDKKSSSGGNNERSYLERLSSSGKKRLK